MNKNIFLLFSASHENFGEKVWNYTNHNSKTISPNIHDMRFWVWRQTKTVFFSLKNFFLSRAETVAASAPLRVSPDIKVLNQTFEQTSDAQRFLESF